MGIPSKEIVDVTPTMGPNVALSVSVTTEPGTHVLGDQFDASFQFPLTIPDHVPGVGQFEYPAIGSAASSAKLNAFFHILLV
jgi:hypothetical protein